jgi:hypothetical protein
MGQLNPGFKGVTDIVAIFASPPLKCSYYIINIHPKNAVISDFPFPPRILKCFACVPLAKR